VSRPSVESLSVVPVLPGSRIAPPEYLNEPQKAVWRGIVASKAADWFSEGDAPLLEDYVRCIVAGRAMVAETKEFIENSRLKMALARSLRLTQQSRYKPDKSSKGEGPVKPWDKSQRS
jgi:hypothetical protein